MIWFDAVLEHPADDELVRRCFAALLEQDVQGVDVVHGVENMRNAPVTCVVHEGSANDYSQLVTTYLAEAFRQPDILASGARLAQLLDRSLLLANDATANPYSFILVSRTGALSIVSVDPEALDTHDRYIILKQEEP